MTALRRPGAHRPPAFRHAVVLGAGMAGLLAARAVADHADAVTVVDADHLRAAPESRAGVPQGQHAHGLMAGGLRELDRMLPGFAGELRTAGGVPVDLGADFVWGSPFGWGTRFTAGLDALVASRGLLEWTVRQRLESWPGVRFLPRQRAEGLCGDAHRVTGVRLRDADAPDTVSTLDADLVVDATGRGSRAGHWLAELGCPTPPVTEVDARIGYATRVFQAPADRPTWRACSLMMMSPLTRGGILVTTEGDRWIVTLAGVGADRPSGKAEDFLPFARSLSSPAIADALETAAPLSEVRTTRATSNRRRHLDGAGATPSNMLLTGDSVCAFNPIYAQGMAMAVFGAGLLQRTLRRHTPGSDLARTYHRRLSRLHDRCWMMSTTADSRFPGATDGGATRVQRAMSAWFDRVVVAGTSDRRVQEVYLGVLNLTRNPLALARPDVLVRILRSGSPRGRTLAPHPSGEDRRTAVPDAGAGPAVDDGAARRN